MLDDIYFNRTRLRETTLEEICNLLPSLIISKFPNHVHFLAASSVVAALDSEELNDIFNSGISLCDSRPLGAVLRRKNSHFYNIRGSDFLREIVRIDDGTKSHFFIIPTIEIYNSLVNYTKNLNPKFRFAGYLVPEFAKSFENEYQVWSSKINISNSDFVWVGLGSPKQDYIAHQLNEATGKTCIAIGAALEFISGVKAEAPRFVQVLYLEWLFRLINDPRRLFLRYTVGNFRFLLQVAKFLINLNKIT